MLVAAAAGSGKTAVLVERIIYHLIAEHDPVHVDRLLVATFTNAAAAEMRQRVGVALEEKLAAQPHNLHLRRQLSLLNQASISTIHAFCSDVLRKYYYKIGLDPGFRILDETEATLLREDVLEELLEENYSQEENEPFFQLVDAYSNDRSDIELQLLIERLYNFSRSHPWPDIWLDEVVASYEVTNGTSVQTFAWGKQILDEVGKQLSEAAQQLEVARTLILEPGGPEPYMEAIEADLAQVRDLMTAKNDWNELYERFETVTFVRLKPCRGDEIDRSLQEEVKQLRQAARDIVQDARTNYFSVPAHVYLDDLAKLLPLIKTLTNLVKEFDQRFSELKMEKSALDFSDIEHYCLKILLHENAAPGELMPSEAARNYKQQFIEVLVDEYQDTNFVQEAIIQLISREQNLFLVGDVKQSIYGFRLAEPSLFMEKYDDYTESGNEHGLRIDLSKNFRSRTEVIDSTNFIFKQIMDEEIGELTYDEKAALQPGLPYPEASNKETELIIIDQADDDEEADALRAGAALSAQELADVTREQLEIRAIAKQIKQLIGTEGNEKALVYDNQLQRMRPIQYRDIVILMRSTSRSAGVIMEELRKQGIPAYVEMSTGYFEATEISVMMSLLKVIDNPDQDIPLAALLRSPIIGLTEEELANVRIANKESSFYDALTTFLEKEDESDLCEKLSTFKKKLSTWRTAARQGALSDLIWQIYRETNYYDFVGGIPGGAQRQANLRALYDRAKQFEQTSFRGLFRFLRFIERMQESGRDLGTAKALGEQEDVVRLMTIHRSKGLEFPVVFVAGISKQFNMQDLHAKVLLHKQYGLGTKLIDADKRLSYPTILQRAMKEHMTLEMLSEEMRILYVAMTRAREKLYLVGTLKDAEKELEKWQQHVRSSQWTLDNYTRRKSRSYLDWIGPALIRHRDSTNLRVSTSERDIQAENIYSHESNWKISVMHASQLKDREETKEGVNDDWLSRLREGKEIPMASEQKAQIYAQLHWVYPFDHETEIKAKQTVTEIKRQHEVVDSFSEQRAALSNVDLVSERPRFLQKNKLTAAERGTIMHTIMQHLPFSKNLDYEAIHELVSQLIEREIVTKEQAVEIDLSLIFSFTRTPLFKRIVHANNVHREIPFTYTLPAFEGEGNDETYEKMLVQGVVDLIIEEEDGIVLIDYKTDAITERFANGFQEAKQVLLDRYEGQLTLYAEAITEIWKKRVKEKYLYFFDGNHTLQL